MAKNMNSQISQSISTHKCDSMFLCLPTFHPSTLPRLSFLFFTFYDNTLKEMAFAYDFDFHKVPVTLNIGVGYWSYIPSRFSNLFELRIMKIRSLMK